MRLDGRDGHRAAVIDCNTNQRIRNVVWADDQTHRYAVAAGVYQREIRLDVRQARLIVICPRLVLIDPKEQDDEKTIELITESAA